MVKGQVTAKPTRPYTPVRTLRSHTDGSTHAGRMSCDKRNKRETLPEENTEGNTGRRQSILDEKHYELPEGNANDRENLNQRRMILR